MRAEMGRRRNAVSDVRIAMAAEVKVLSEHMDELDKYSLE